MKRMCRSIQNKTLVQTKDGVCGLDVPRCVVCWTVVSKFSSGCVSVCCDAVYQTFVFRSILFYSMFLPCVGCISDSPV